MPWTKRPLRQRQARNPERDILDWLTESRDPADTYTIVLTYPVVDIDAGRKKDALQHHKAWVTAEHSHASLIAERRQQAHHFVLVEGTPFKIELGDETADWQGPGALSSVLTVRSFHRGGGGRES